MRSNTAPSRTLLNRTVCILATAIALGLTALAQITPSQDAYTNTATPTANFGAKTLLDVQSATQNTYIQFDLSSIPAGYTGTNIAKAALKLYVNTVPTAGSFNVDFVNGAWDEKTITANLLPALGTTIVPSVPLSSSNVKDYILIDITPALQAWLNKTQPNDGIAIIGNSPLNATFDSKESTTQSHPPELDIVFASSGGGITGINTANGSGLIGGGNSGTLNLSLTNACAANQVLKWSGSAWSCANLTSGGTVTSVGLSAQSSDFTVTGSPITSAGTLGLNWISAPTAANTANAIVKRDSTGSFNANNITTTGTVSSTTANPFGIYGSSSSSGGVGVFGTSATASGPTSGVYGTNFSLTNNATGVFGQALSSSMIAGYTQGVTGVSNSPRGIGVLGYTTQLSHNGSVLLGAPNGILGDSYLSNGTGVAASADDSTAFFAVNNSFQPTAYIVNNSTSAAYVFFSTGTIGDCRTDWLGDLACTGTITANAGLARVDHPLDPANKYLAQAAVYSPDSKSVYDGVIRLDSNGEASVELPSYIQALNGDFRYQLTSIGAPGPNLYVAEKVNHNRFKIAGGQPGAEVSWQVTGIRQDAYSKAHPLIVEEEKPSDERGYYLHAEAFGLNRDRSLTTLRRSQLDSHRKAQVVSAETSKK